MVSLSPSGNRRAGDLSLAFRRKRNPTSRAASTAFLYSIRRRLGVFKPSDSDPGYGYGVIDNIAEH